MPTIQPPIILLHGLHMNTLAMRPLANFLKNQGFTVHLFRYYSVKDPLVTHSKRLQQFISKLGLTEVQLIGHSLGGLVIRQFLHDNLTSPNPIKIGKVITLATPHLGSIVARYAKRIHPITVGKAYDSLTGDCPPLPAGIVLGIIAGNKPYGLGKSVIAYHNKTILNNQPKQHQNDGTVYVSETYLDGATDHIILPASHSGVLFDKAVFGQVCCFLDKGKFAR